MLDSIVLFLVNLQLTPPWFVMRDLFVMDELLDRSLPILQLVLFVLQEVTVFKVAQHNHSVILVGLVSSRVLMIQRLVLSARQDIIARVRVVVQLQPKYALQVRSAQRALSIT